MAASDRIIQHLNKDHPESLSLYLRHYQKLSTYASSDPVVTSITLENLIIQSRGKAYPIPFNPPMKSWAEARQRTVEMDREARAGLGLSSIRITSYEPPKSPLHVTVFALCVLTVGVFLGKDYIVPGTWVYDNVLPWFPGGAERFLGIVNTIALPVVGIHFGEAFLLDRLKLRKHGVERGTALWWKWILSCSLEGFGSFQRINAIIKRKTLEAEKVKH